MTVAGLERIRARDRRPRRARARGRPRRGPARDQGAAGDLADPRGGAPRRRRADGGAGPRPRGPDRGAGRARPRGRDPPSRRRGGQLPADRRERRPRRPAARRAARERDRAGHARHDRLGRKARGLLLGLHADVRRRRRAGRRRSAASTTSSSEAQETSLAAVRPGPTGREVDAVARDIIDAAGHADHFGHGLGHGVGLEIHEGPRLSRLGERVLEAGHGRHRGARRLRAGPRRRADRGSRRRHARTGPTCSTRCRRPCRSSSLR